MCQAICFYPHFSLNLREKKISAQSELWIKMTRKAPIEHVILATSFPGTQKLATQSLDAQRWLLTSACPPAKFFKDSFYP